MNSHPPRWTLDQFVNSANISASNFRTLRLADTVAWTEHYHQARKKFEKLFEQLGDLDPQRFTDATLSLAYKGKLGEALRYLAGPPISDDDLKVIADVASLAPTVISADHESIRKVFAVIERVIDPFRFPWVVAQRAPTAEEKSAIKPGVSAILGRSQTACSEPIWTLNKSSMP